MDKRSEANPFPMARAGETRLTQSAGEHTRMNERMEQIATIDGKSGYQTSASIPFRLTALLDAGTKTYRGIRQTVRTGSTWQDSNPADIRDNIRDFYDITPTLGSIYACYWSRDLGAFVPTLAAGDDQIGDCDSATSGSASGSLAEECGLTDHVCIQTANEVVRIDFPHLVRVRRFASLAAAECDNISTIDVCDCTATSASGGVTNAECYASMQNRHMVLSVSGATCEEMEAQDVSMFYKSGDDWTAATGSDDAYDNNHSAGWVGTYSASGGNCDFTIYIGFTGSSDTWYVWIDSYANRQSFDITTCSPFNATVSHEACDPEVVEPTIETPCCSELFPAVLTATYSLVSNDAGGCNGLDGQSIELNYDSDDSKWKGSKTIDGVAIILHFYCDGGNWVFDQWCGGTPTVTNDFTSENCDPILFVTEAHGHNYCCGTNDSSQWKITFSG